MLISAKPAPTQASTRPVPAPAATKPAPVPAANRTADTRVAAPAAAPTHQDGQLQARDGQPIAYRTTEPAGTPKAIVVMQQGTYGQPQFWDGMGEKLAAKGIKSYAVGSRVETRDFHIHASDLDQVVARAKQENPGVPVTVMGVSLGAMIAMDWNAERNRDKTPVVLMSPVVLPKYLGLGDLAKVGLGLVSRHFADSRVQSPMSKGARLTTNPASNEDHLPNARQMTVPANLFDDVVKMAATSTVKQSGAPLLVMKAGADEVAANWATGPFMHLVRSSDKTVKTMPGAAHDLSQEYHRPDVVNTLSDWVLSR